MAAFLGRGCAEGRLSPEELSERLDAVYRALTYGELTRVAADLPVEPAATQRRRLRLPAATVCAALLALVLAAYGLAEALAAAPEATLLTLFLLLIIAFAVVALVGSLALAVAPVVALVAGAAWLRRWLERDRQPRLLGPDRIL
jgi:hypothetical protein